MSLASNAARMIRRKGTTISLTRTTQAAPEDEAPWVPGDATTTDVYDMDAFVKGVTAEHVDGTTIVASDLLAIVAPGARHRLSNDAPAGGAVVDIVPEMTDLLEIGGETKVIKKISPVPAAGTPAMFHVFVGS